MDGHEALADLKQISVQIEAAVIADHGGVVLACSPDDGPTGELLCRLAREIWEAADASRRDLGRDALTQVELSTAQGSVFVVRDARHVLLATTAPDPTVGLVFYDLKSALHALDGQPGTPAPTRGADRGLAGGRRHERRGAGRWRGVSGRSSGRLTLAVGSVAGSALIFKRKRERNASRADLYFEDGSMLSLSQGAPEADRLLPLAAEALAATGR